MQEIIFFIRKNLKDIIIFIFLLICFLLIGFILLTSNNNATKEINEIAMIEEEKEEEEQNPTYLYIDVKGAVKNPGVYKVENGTIINEIIELAGGFLSTAYQNGINLSKKVTDEMVIYVYTKTEIKNKRQKTAQAQLPVVK